MCKKSADKLPPPSASPDADDSLPLAAAVPLEQRLDWALRRIVRLEKAVAALQEARHGR